MHVTSRPRADAITNRLSAWHGPVRRGAWLALVHALALLGALGAHAQTAGAGSPPLLGPDGLSGGRYVAAASGADRLSLRVASTLGYGFTESVLGNGDRHHRIAGELALGLVVAPWFQASLGGELRVDRHAPDGPGSELGLLGSSHVATRHVFALGRRFALGVLPRVAFPGADDVRRGFRAASYELSLLAGLTLPHGVALSWQAGYRFDRTRYAVEDAVALLPPQRLAAALSDQDACLLGALLSARVSALRLGLEWSWELATRGRVDAAESPMRLRGALQRVVGERFLPGVELGVDVSTRPAFVGLTRIEPRVWLRVGLAIVLERRPERASKVSASREPPPAPPSEPVAARRTVALRVLDQRGRPIAGARVVFAEAGGSRESTTDTQGWVALEVAADVNAVTIEVAGYEPLVHPLDGGQVETERSVKLRPALPAGEVKGVVRNLAGDPLRARVTVLPQGLRVDSDEHGHFAVGVAPGDYVLKIEADGYETQERKAQVELRGVTIIVVDLRRGDK